MGVNTHQVKSAGECAEYVWNRKNLRMQERERMSKWKRKERGSGVLWPMSGVIDVSDGGGGGYDSENKAPV